MHTESLISQVKAIESSPVNFALKERLNYFKSFKNKSTADWYSELCFCILAANSKAVSSIAIQQILDFHGFLNNSKNSIAKTILENKHRFHNNKAKYILESRKHHDIKYKLEELKDSDVKEIREWLVKNVKGFGLKEASHFLRNTGHENLAILDRHILNTLIENRIIEKPKNLNKKSYLEIEKVFQDLARLCRISPAKLDLILWYMKTGEVLK